MIRNLWLGTGALINATFVGNQRCHQCGEKSGHRDECKRCRIGQDDIAQYVGQLRRTSWRRADKLRRPVQRPT